MDLPIRAYKTSPTTGNTFTHHPIMTGTSTVPTDMGAFIVATPHTDMVLVNTHLHAAAIVAVLHRLLHQLIPQ